jgi:hypothetical protein
MERTHARPGQQGASDRRLVRRRRRSNCANGAVALGNHRATGADRKHQGCSGKAGSCGTAPDVDIRSRRYLRRQGFRRGTRFFVNQLPPHLPSPCRNLPVRCGGSPRGWQRRGRIPRSADGGNSGGVRWRCQSISHFGRHAHRLESNVRLRKRGVDTVSPPDRHPDAGDDQNLRPFSPSAAAKSTFRSRAQASKRRSRFI